jgi:hypothetical protein
MAMWHMFASKRRFFEELAAAAGPLTGLWGLAVGINGAVLAGVSLIFLAALLNDDRWRELAFLVVVAAIGAALDKPLGIANGAAYSLLALSTFNLAFLFMARASVLEEAQSRIQSGDTD